jgi:DNA-binding response OmpR family regulator
MGYDEQFTILVVEDDRATREFLADNLIADGYEPLTAGSVSEALRRLEAEFPDLVLIDVGLPDGSGLDFVRDVRTAKAGSGINPRVPIIGVSGRATELDRVRGFERGCDDYVCKPFSYPELRARIGALLARANDRPRVGRLRVAGLDIDPAGRSVRLRGKPIALSQKEFALLRTLASEPARVWSKDELMRVVWGVRARCASRTLDSHACRLRRKLAVDGDRFVINVWGVGYRLLDPPAPDAEASPRGGGARGLEVAGR